MKKLLTAFVVCFVLIVLVALLAPHSDPSFTEATGISFETHESGANVLLIASESYAEREGLLDGDVVADTKSDVTLPLCNGVGDDVALTVLRNGEEIEVVLRDVPKMDCA